MSDLISRQAAIKMCREPRMRNADCSDFEMEIMMLPSAEPERKTGAWIYKDMGGWRCSECDEQAPFWSMASTQNLPSFCPSCGADMRGEEDG